MGTAAIPSSLVVRGCSSTLSLSKRTLGSSSFAARSNIGAMARQGPPRAPKHRPRLGAPRALAYQAVICWSVRSAGNQLKLKTGACQICSKDIEERRHEHEANQYDQQCQQARYAAGYVVVIFARHRHRHRTGWNLAPIFSFRVAWTSIVVRIPTPCGFRAAIVLSTARPSGRSSAFAK